MIHFPSKKSSSAFSETLMFLFRLAWVARIQIPTTLSFIFALFNARVQINLDMY